jgi:hypothetical protein
MLLPRILKYGSIEQAAAITVHPARSDRGPTPGAAARSQVVAEGGGPTSATLATVAMRAAMADGKPGEMSAIAKKS